MSTAPRQRRVPGAAFPRVQTRCLLLLPRHTHARDAIYEALSYQMGRPLQARPSCKALPVESFSRVQASRAIAAVRSILISIAADGVTLPFR